MYLVIIEALLGLMDHADQKAAITVMRSACGQIVISEHELRERLLRRTVPVLPAGLRT
jgi:hypothetical protein